MQAPLSFEDAIDELITLLYIQDERFPGTKRIPLERFDGLEAIAKRYSALRGPVFEHPLAEESFPSGYDVSLLADTEGGFFPPDTVWAMLRIKKVSARGVAKHVRGRSRHVTRIDLMEISVIGSYAADTFYARSDDFINWRMANPEKWKARPDEVVHRGWTGLIAFAMNLSITRRRHWRVNIGYEGTPTISVPVTPPAVKELFRFRDMPSGASRRAALRHWVVNHWRKNHDDPQTESEIREHFRGATQFNWNGLRCEVIPSAMDQGLVDAAKLRAPQRRPVEAR